MENIAASLTKGNSPIFTTNENSNPKTRGTITDSNALYKQLIDTSFNMPVKCIHPKVFGEINNQINALNYGRQDYAESSKTGSVNRSMVINYKRLEQSISNIKSSNKKGIKLCRQYKNLHRTGDANNSVNLSKRNSSFAEYSTQQLQKENQLLRSEIEEKNRTIEVLAAQNKKLQETSLNTAKLRSHIREILTLAAKEYAHLQTASLAANSCEELLEQVHRLVGYLVIEKKALVDKCEKLAEVNGGLLKVKEQWSAGHVLRLDEENRTMKKDLELICAKKVYPDACNHIENWMRRMEGLKCCSDPLKLRQAQNSQIQGQKGGRGARRRRKGD